MLANVPRQSLAQDYQWCVTLDGKPSAETGKHPEAFLWIPDTCTKVKAVVFSQQNMTEETIFRNPEFQKTLSRLGFAIVWTAPNFSQEWLVSDGCQERFETMMKSLDAISGYSELATAPIVPIGHSAMATMPWNFAAWNPERTLAIISYHGDAPRTNLCGYGRENIEWGRSRNIDGIPGLMIEGEWEWWKARVNPALSFRMKYPGSCISFLCDAGHGHFDATPQSIGYICKFLEKVVSARLTGSSKLKKLSPYDGWYLPRWDKEAPLSSYVTVKGPSSVSTEREKYEFEKRTRDHFWYIDREMAELTRSIYASSLGRKTAHIGYTRDGKLLGYTAKLHAGTIVEPEFASDGLTFHFSAAFTDTTRSVLAAKHPKSKIDIDVINGPCTKLNDSTFRFSAYRIGLDNPRRSTDIWLQAVAETDGEYKAAVQQLEVKCPYRIKDGKEQTLTFAAIRDITSKVKTVKLRAKADSGLPVGFYVKYGPAHIEGDKLHINAIPPHAKFPIKVSVVAWQYGISGKYNTAESVERTFLINNE